MRAQGCFQLQNEEAVYSFTKDYIAYYGLDCETCEARLATVPDDQALREKVAKEWPELNGAEITPGMINCSGCRIDGVKRRIVAHFALLGIVL